MPLGFIWSSNICRHEYEILTYFPHDRGWFLYVKWNEAFEVIIFQINYVTAHLSSSTTVAVTTAGGGGSPLRVTSPPNSTAAGGGASSSSSPLHQVPSVTVWKPVERKCILCYKSIKYETFFYVKCWNAIGYNTLQYLRVNTFYQDVIVRFFLLQLRKHQTKVYVDFSCGYSHLNIILTWFDQYFNIRLFGGIHSVKPVRIYHIIVHTFTLCFKLQSKLFYRQ